MVISASGMLGLIVFSIVKEQLSTANRLTVVAIIIGGILFAFLFLLVSDVLSETGFNKSDLLKEVCRLYGMMTIFISLFSAIAIIVIAKDNSANKNVYTLLVPASILYVAVGYFFIWYGESLSHTLVLFWYMANGTTFVFAGIGAMIILLLDALSSHITFYREYLVVVMILSICLGIALFVTYYFNSNPIL